MAHREPLDDSGDFFDPYLMKNMDLAATRIAQAISGQQRVIVYGDYDVDGISGTAILVRTLKKFNAFVSYRIPHRFDDGYGLHEKYIEECRNTGTKLIITVDCGISCASQISLAKKYGIDVIITDHHTIPENVPEDAHAILHPLQRDCPYPFKGLTGSAVAFKLAHALLQKLSPHDHLNFLESLTDFASFGTIADCGPLIGENRTIVKRGLAAFQRTHWSGLRHMKRLAKIENDKIDTTTIGFRLAPRINAAGRIDHPYVALQLLLREEDDAQTLALAKKLESLNAQRQEMTRRAIDEVMRHYKSELHKNLFMAASPDWHTGILGLIAARATETFGVPSIILQDRGETLVASCRSRDGCDIMQLLAPERENFITFGGHAQAAGFTVSKEKFPLVEKNMYRRASEIWNRSSSNSGPTLNIDCHIDFEELTFENAMAIEKMEPFGIGNEKPIFALQAVKISEISLVGKEKNHAKLSIQSPSSKDIPAIFFSAPEKILRQQISPDALVDLACHLELNRFKGRATPQLQVRDIAM